MLIRTLEAGIAGAWTKGKAMNGMNRHFNAGVALVLLTALVAGCETTYPRAHVVPEDIPAQVCTNNGDSDGDGVTDCYDRCPGTVRGLPVDPDGCPLPQPMEPKPFRG